jgi:DHA1 family bicyclomycin/chloramphenicol resistance-like MFS transporter
MVLRPDTLAMTASLALMTAIGPMSTDMYLPSLPDIVATLHASISSAQLTLSAFLIGFACGQIVYGPFADRFGRKPVLLASFLLYAIGSFACAAAPSIGWLIFARVVQALGAAGPIIIARAIVRDLYDERRAARELALMGAMMTVAPMIAPTLGGLIQASMGWRAIFVASAGAAATFATYLLLAMPETIRVRRPEPISPASILRSFAIVSADPRFRLCVVANALMYGGLFGYISASSFVLQGVDGLSPAGFGWAFGGGAGAGGVGMLSGRWAVGWLGVDRAIGLGLSLVALGGATQLIAVLIEPRSALAIVLPMMIYLLGLGIAMPQIFASAMSPFPERAGAASSLAGFAQMTTGACIGAIVGATLGRSALPLPISTCALGVGAMAAYFLGGGVRPTGRV